MVTIIRIRLILFNYVVFEILIVCDELITILRLVFLVNDNLQSSMKQICNNDNVDRRENFHGSKDFISRYILNNTNDNCDRVLSAHVFATITF